MMLKRLLIALGITLLPATAGAQTVQWTTPYAAQVAQPLGSDYVTLFRPLNFPPLWGTVTGLLAASSLQFGPQGSLFPYGGTYAGLQTFAPGTSPLGNNAARGTGTGGLGSVLNLTNLFPHGVLNSASTAVLTTNPFANDLTSDPGYGCVLGFPNISDIALGEETGAVTLCPTANGAAPFMHVAGTFGPTKFTPTVPMTLPAGFPTAAVWIYSNDQPVPYEGLANATLNSKGQATVWTTIGGGWYQQGTLTAGPTGMPGNPTGTAAYIGVQDKQWTSNFIDNSAPLSVTGSVTSGNQTIPVSGASAQYLAPRQWLEDTGPSGALAPHTRIVSVADDYSSITVAPPPTGNAGAGETLTFGVQPTNRSVLMEGDSNNGTGEAYDNFTYQFTGNTTASSRHITNLSTTAPGGNTLYPHLACESIAGEWSGAIDIDAIQYGSSSMDMDAAATGTAIGTTIRCQARFDDAGGGIDVRGEYSANDFVARGYPVYGFRGMAATDTLFYAGGGPDGGKTTPPIYGFRSDHSWWDVDEDFAITDDLEGKVLGSWDGLNGILVDLNNHTLPASTLPNQTLLHLGAIDSNVTSATLDAFGSTSEIIFRSAHGTAASPSALTTSDAVGGLNFGGYDGTSWAIGGAQIAAVPSATWTSSSHPLDMYFQTTAIGSTTAATALRIFNDGGVSTGAAVDEGAGTINAAGVYYANGTAGVSCPANTVNLTTFTVKNGIVTHC